VLDLVRDVADSRATVLLLGESGTGKGVLAAAIHDTSSRAPGPFLNVICSAIPESLLEAEMFGHDRGAFTGADRRRCGVFETADGGTVLLDEIGDMPLSLQAKLLGVVADRSFSRIGETARRAVDVRIIAATHRDLARHVEEGLFREDLYYRLRVATVVLPALRDRREDILPLAEQFLAEFNLECNRNVQGIDSSARRFLEGQEWRGNIRELRNAIERAVLSCRGDFLTERDLALDLGYRPRSTVQRSKRFRLPAEGIDMEELEKDLLRQAMERSTGNQSRAATLLGLTRDQMRYRLKKFGMLESPPPTPGPPPGTP
jgi:transcriptional regulator with PAS, ATPase and Fis domain